MHETTAETCPTTWAGARRLQDQPECAPAWNRPSVPVNWQVTHCPARLTARPRCRNQLFPRWQHCSDMSVVAGAGGQRGGGRRHPLVSIHDLAWGGVRRGSGVCEEQSSLIFHGAPTCARTAASHLTTRTDECHLCTSLWFLWNLGNVPEGLSVLLVEMRARQEKNNCGLWHVGSQWKDVWFLFHKVVSFYKSLK